MEARIRNVTASAYVVPTDSPESDGTLEWDSTTMVLVEIDAGEQTGLGYSYTSAAAARIIHDQLRPGLAGADALAIPALHAAMRREVRNLGQPGVAAAAISAVDCALWDLKARLLGLPLFRLLGAVRQSVPVYGSGGFTSYSTQRLCRQLSDWVEQGIARVKMKVGRDPAADLHRVNAARGAIGTEAELFVDANGAYDRKQALSFSERFVEAGTNWFEEPVSSDDLAGLRLLRDRSPASMEIAAGEYGCSLFDFRRLLEAGAVDVLQPDATRCGGATGFLAAAALCEAHCVPLSAHTAPALHAHLCCATRPARHVEYFHDHVRIEALFFDGAQRPQQGELRPDPECPGLGLEFKRIDAEPYQI